MQVQMVNTGEHNEYYWLVSATEIRTLADLVVEFHRGLRLCITSFDSGPLRLSEEELAAGWVARNEVAVSPPLDGNVDIPHDQYDEWYLVSDESALDGASVFVNYCGFSPVAATADPDLLATIREQFWSQLGRVLPESYVAMGDNDVVVSRNRRFMQAVQAATETSG